MTNIRVHPNAKNLVDSYINNLPERSREVCNKLRKLILSVSSNIQEDWKWGHPNYYCNGMLCGMWAFKEHVTLVFFQGALINDSYSVLSSTDNLRSRHIKYSDVSQINEEIIVDYIKQAITNNTNGLRINQTKVKSIEIPFYIKNALDNAGLLESFNNMSYTHKKEYILWIKAAKKEATKNRRIEKMITILRNKFGMSSL